MYKDLREFIAEVEKLGALRRVMDADPHIELGGITEVAAGLPECPALLFDRIKGYPAGFRIFTNATTNPQRAALALGLDPDAAAARRTEGLDGEAPDAEAAQAGDGEGRGVPGEQRQRRRASICASCRRRCGTPRTAGPISARARS